MATKSILPKGVYKLQTPSQPSAIAFPYGLGVNGVHELCERTYGDMSSVLGFALAANPGRLGCVFYIQQHGLSCEHGDVLLSAAQRFSPNFRRALHVRVYKSTDALWAVEEAVKSSAVGLVIAELEACDFTASRRLALASSRYGIPILLLLPHHSEGASAATARWRIKPLLSANNRYDARALGAPRWQARLERSRQAPHLAGRIFNVEWNDETLSLTMVPKLVSHASKAPEHAVLSDPIHHTKIAYPSRFIA